LTQAPLETVKSFDEATKTHSRVQQLYRVFNQISDGADGGVHGFGGSLTPMSLSLTLEKLQVEGKSFVDLGAGDGRVALSAVKIFNATYACG
jgi:ubiquinone/menaquinone biosynthesis C-methylase UbiE